MLHELDTFRAVAHLQQLTIYLGALHQRADKARPRGQANRGQPPGRTAMGRFNRQRGGPGNPWGNPGPGRTQGAGRLGRNQPGGVPPRWGLYKASKHQEPLGLAMRPTKSKKEKRAAQQTEDKKVNKRNPKNIIINALS